MKIILALDLYETNILQNPSIFEELSRWCEDVKSEVQPVYVHASSMTSEMIMNHIVDPKAEILEKIKPFKPLHVINEPLEGRKKEIEALLTYAKNEKADLIALVSQGKSNLEKKLLGSFAEALLLKAEVPLLFLEEEAQTRSKINKVLFATDFSEPSKEAFSIFLKQIKHQNPEVVIFNAIPLPQFTASGVIYSQALNILPQQYWDEQKIWAEKKGNELVELAQAQGFKVKLEIANQVYSIENSIHEVIKREQVKLVAMVSVSSPLQRFLLGSVSRSILRTRVKPIWICGPLCLGNL